MKRLATYIIMLYFRLSFVRQMLWSLIVFCFFALGAAVFFSSGEIETKPIGWEKTFLVSSYQLTGRNLQVASKGNFVVAVYEARGDNRSGIFISLSFNGGVSFLPPLTVAASDYKNDKKPFAALSSKGAIAVAWHDFVQKDSASRVFISQSKDMGATWTQPALVNLGLEMEILPMVYFDDRDGLHLFYHGLKEGNFNLYHAISENGSAFHSMEPLINLKQSMKGAFFPAILASGDRFFVVWQGRGVDFMDDLYFIKSGNYGSSWSMAKKITKSKGNNAVPALTLFKDTLYLAYQNNDEKAWSIKLIKGRDYGDSWDTVPVGISETPANCYCPSISATDNKICIAWYDERERVAQVYSRIYNPGDGSIGAEAKLSDRNIASLKPSIIYAGKKALALWEEQGRIMAKYSDEYVAPPVVYSATHSEGGWSRNPTAIMEWREPDDESGITGFVAVVNNLPEFNPPDIPNMKPNATRKVLPELQDGTSYFHLRAIDGAGNISRTVHYRLQVASNPPPMPLVFSPTHKEGEDTPSNAPVFRWAVDDVDRMKGFYYSIGKGGVARPETFTSGFELKLSDLEEGGYFFSICSVDKTNQVGPPATYYFVVGHAEQIDIDKIKTIAKGSLMKETRIARGIRPAIGEPVVNIVLPFSRLDVFTSSSFRAKLEVKNIPADQIDGFAFIRAGSKEEVPEKIDFRTPQVAVDRLTDGTHFLGARCRYFRYIDGKKKYFWTRPAYVSFAVALPRERGPVEYIIADLTKRISHRPAFASGLVFMMFFCTVFFGFGTRVGFYSRLVQFKVMTVLRLIIGQ